MTSSSYELPVLKSVARPLAGLGGNHGYRVEGDAVYLRISLRDVAAAAHEINWALQLWACPAGAVDPFGAGCNLVAEAWLPPIIEMTGSDGELELIAAATPPAGRAEWTMILALVASDGENFDQVHDFATYPRLESFQLPRLEGTVRYHVDGGQVRVEVERVANPREPRNVSGTLSLELWGLTAPYSGGRFEGEPLAAGATLGSLSGQESWHSLSFDLPYSAPTVGTWHPVLMLREWVGNGYLTRDFTSFPEPIVVAPRVKAAPAPKPAEQPVAVAAVAAKPAPTKTGRATKAGTAPKRTRKSPPKA